MEFFEKLSNTISAASKGAVKKTKEELDIAKINSKIKVEREKLQKKYLEIGEEYYKRNSEANVEDKELQEMLDVAKECINAIEEYEKEIRLVKGVICCSNCGKQIPSDAVFCNYCGNQTSKEEREEVDDTVNEEQEVAEEEKEGIVEPVEEEQEVLEEETGEPVEEEQEVVIEEQEEVEEKKEEIIEIVEKEQEKVTEEPKEIEEVKEKARFCPNCGKEITDEDMFCGNCGNKLK